MITLIIGVALIVYPTFFLLAALATVGGAMANSGRYHTSQSYLVEVVVELSMVTAGIVILAS